MRKVFLTLCVLFVGVASFAQVPRAKMSSYITSCKDYEGAEVVHFGGLGAFLMKSAASLVSIEEPELREVLPLIKGLRGFYLLDYSDCRECDQRKISKKLNRMLSKADLLMEVNDDGNAFQVYGTDTGTKIKDVVIYTPADCTIICCFGSIDTDALAMLMKE